MATSAGFLLPADTRRYVFDSWLHPSFVGWSPKRLEIHAAQAKSAISGKSVISNCDGQTEAIAAK
jgi:hypothetical protein